MARKAKPAAETAVGAAEFKARCLELMDRVQETREAYVITKHGRPVAKLVPHDPPRRKPSFFGSMPGTVLRYEAPFEPVSSDWLQDPRLARKK
jgi:prevent-host-death family protein